MEAKQAEVSDLSQAVLAIDRKLQNYKELAVYVKNYHENLRYNTAYRKAKNKESYYEQNESNLLLFDAADRFIRSKGLDPEKITYDQVMQGIEKLTAEKEKTRTDYRARSKELKEIEKQMEIIQTHLTRYNLTPEKEEKRDKQR